MELSGSHVLLGLDCIDIHGHIVSPMFPPGSLTLKLASTKS